MSSNATSEASLKLLKVAELRELLQKNSIPIPAKSNKAELIQLCLNIGAGTKAGEDATDDLLAPPEDFDWDAEEPTPTVLKANNTPSKPISKPAPSSTKSSAPIPSLATSTSTTANDGGVSNDTEYEKKKQRAARFGIPLVESKKKPEVAATGDTAGGKGKGVGRSMPVVDETEIVAKTKRAERFGTGSSKDSSSLKKRPVTDEAIDDDEKERRRKRAERFGISSAA